MRARAATLLRAVPWLVPAAVLVVSGLAKIIDPQGTIPRPLARITDFLPYPVLLRFLGAFELLVAGHLFRPNTRRVGTLAALGLLSGFTFLVAANAQDQDFLRHCGCFGGLDAGAAIGPFRGAGAIILRNALLCGMLAGSLLANARSRLWAAWAGGLGAAALVFFAAGFVAELRLARYDRIVRAVLDQARQRNAFSQPLPEIGLVAADGRVTTSRRELHEADHVVFFSPTCPHCRRLAPSWGTFAKRLESRGGRLVLLAMDEGPAVAAFKRTFGCEEVPHYVVPDRMDPLRWGVERVPQLVVLGRGDRALYHEQQRGNESFASSIATIAPRVAGLGDLAWTKIAGALVGPGTVVGPMRRHGDLLIAEARTRQGEAMRICVGTVSGTPAHVVELALGVDGRTRIRGILPLTIGGYARAVDPDAQLFAPLAGASLAAAAREAERRAGEPTMEAPVWESVGVLLAAFADLLPAESPVHADSVQAR